MDVLWAASGTTSVREVAAAPKDRDLGRTTAMTVLNRLPGKESTAPASSP